jgi:hydroxyacylglutathione hydrolase
MLRIRCYICPPGVLRSGTPNVREAQDGFNHNASPGVLRSGTPNVREAQDGDTPMKIHDNIYMGSASGRVYIIDDGDALVMIDCFIVGAIKDVLREFAEDDGLDLGRLQALLLTHMHYDHAAGAAYVRATHSVPVVCHALDAEALVVSDRLATADRMRWTNTDQFTPTVPIDHLVDDGDVLEIGSSKIEVVHLPGHTRGGVGYLWNGHFFTGDTMMPGGGIGWSDVHWGSNLADHETSIRRIAEVAPDRIYGGHGDPGAYTPGQTDVAHANVARLNQAGLAPRVSERAPRRGASDEQSAVTIVVSGVPEAPDMPVSQPSDLGDRPLFEVASGKLHGMIRPIGPLHGLILNGEGNLPITRPMQATMNLEHYCETGRCGPFVPRVAVGQSYSARRDDISIRFEPHPDWAVASTVTYTIRDDDAFDIVFSFEFERDYERFEAFIASYFWGQTIPYVAAGKEVFRPVIKNGAQLFFPRDDDARRQVVDGRWDFLLGNKLFAETDDEGRNYDAAMTIHRDGETGWSFLQMVEESECASLSVNTFAYAQDFSIVGRDVKKGSTVDVRARVVYRELESPDQALDVYRAYQSGLAEK